MTTITLLPDKPGSPESTFRAVAGTHQSVGRTAGEALDAIMTQMGEGARGALAVVQHPGPDSFFTAEQQLRLGELMSRWRVARDTGTSLPGAEQAELDALVEAEVRAAGARAAVLLRELGS